LAFTGKNYFRILGLDLGLGSVALALHVSGLGLGLLALALTPLAFLTSLLQSSNEFQTKITVFNMIKQYKFSAPKLN